MVLQKSAVAEAAVAVVWSLELANYRYRLACNWAEVAVAEVVVAEWSAVAWSKS